MLSIRTEFGLIGNEFSVKNSPRDRIQDMSPIKNFSVSIRNIFEQNCLADITTGSDYSKLSAY